MATYVKIRIRRDNLENWTAANPLLLLGEIGCDMTNKMLKVGNGTDRWNDLEYIKGGESSDSPIPPSPNPNPKKGDMYYNTTLNVIMYYDGSKWLPIGIVIAANAPASPTEGLVWYSTTNKKLSYWTGSKWAATGGITISPSAPSSPNEGDMYYNSTDKKMYYWNGSKWVVIGEVDQNVIIPIIKNFGVIEVLQSGKPAANNTYNGKVIYVINDKCLYIYRNNAWMVLDWNIPTSTDTPVVTVIQSGRPSNPKNGNAIYVTSEKKMYVYHNNDWLLVTTDVEQFIANNPFITVVESGRPSNPKANMVIYVINEKKLYIYRNNAWLEMTAAGGGEADVIIVDTYNATSPTGKTGQLLYAKNTKHFYYWTNNAWTMMLIESDGNVDIDAIVAEVLRQLESHISNYLKARNLFGLGYDVIQREGGGKPKVIKFEDNVRCMVYYGGTNSNGDYSKYVYRVVSDNKYQVDFKYKFADTGGDKDVTWSSAGIPSNTPTFFVGRTVKKLSDAEYTALNIQWP